MLAGIIILLIGVLYLLELVIPSFVIDYSVIWPLIVIVSASYFIIKKGRFDFGNSILLFIGLWWFLINIEILPTEVISYFWPLLLILAGISIIIGSIGVNTKIKKIVQSDKDVSGVQNYYGIFGGVKEKVISQEFVGANIYSIFGGCELDFTEIELKKDSAVINVYSIFGGSEIILPQKFNIKYNSTAIFGGDENKSNGDSKAKKIIHVDCVSIFGGSEIK